MTEFLKLISDNRLGGQPLPKDLAFIIENCSSNLQELGVEVCADPNWAPWADQSYLTEEDKRNTDIMANVEAIDRTFNLIRFVAQTDEGVAIGYWCGPDSTPVATAPLVSYDTEGQFNLCGHNFLEALYCTIYDEDEIVPIKEKLEDHGFEFKFTSLDDLTYPTVELPPSQFHENLYYELLRQQNKAG